MRALNAARGVVGPRRLAFSAGALGAVLAIVLLLGASRAAAEPPVDAQLFRPAPGPRSVFGVDLPDVASHLGVSAGVFLNYAARPLRLGDAGGQGGTRPLLVQSELGLDVVGAVSLFQTMELGLGIPFERLDLVTEDGGTQRESAVGDLRLQIKVPLLRKTLRVAAVLRASLPTGDPRVFAGVVSWVFAPTVLTSVPIGRGTLAFEAGYWFRRREQTAGDFALDDEVALGVGVVYPIVKRLDVRGEVRSWIGVAAPEPTSDGAPVDTVVGGAYRFAGPFEAFLGVGRGLGAGYGTPAARGLVGVRVSAEPEPCADGPEDFDGYRDGDFCADLDNDSDRVADEVDRCPNDPEDRDGFEDRDGCADPDNDADAVADATDRCPVQAEDRDGHEDADGCPDDDNDADRVVDFADDCPMDPEDADHFEDEDGCPEPGPAAATVTVTDTRILISERVYFDFERETIRSVSLPLLQQVAEVLVRTPRIRKVRIEGYADGTGDAGYNLDLSYRRARAVAEYLATQGVDRRRLAFIGYGETRAVASDDTPEGQALNRRVEFTILETGTDAEPPPERTRRRRGRERDGAP